MSHFGIIILVFRLLEVAKNLGMGSKPGVDMSFRNFRTRGEGFISNDG